MKSSKNPNQVARAYPVSVTKTQKEEQKQLFLFVGKLSWNYDMNKVAEKDVKVWLEKALNQEIDISKLLKGQPVRGRRWCVRYRCKPNLFAEPFPTLRTPRAKARMGNTFRPWEDPRWTQFRIKPKVDQDNPTILQKVEYDPRALVARNAKKATARCRSNENKMSCLQIPVL